MSRSWSRKLLCSQSTLKSSPALESMRKSLSNKSQLTGPWHACLQAIARERAHVASKRRSRLVLLSWQTYTQHKLQWVTCALPCAVAFRTTRSNARRLKMLQRILGAWVRDVRGPACGWRALSWASCCTPCHMHPLPSVPSLKGSNPGRRSRLDIPSTEDDYFELPIESRSSASGEQWSDDGQI